MLSETWCRWPDSLKCYIAMEEAFSSCGEAEWRTYSAHFLLISWLIRITVTFWCSLRTYSQEHKWWTACKHCFMTCNTISRVQRLIWKRFRWNFIDTLEGVCSLYTIHAILLIHFTCSVASRLKVLDVFFWATRYLRGFYRFGSIIIIIIIADGIISLPHIHFSRFLSRHWDWSMSHLLTASVSWGVGSPPSIWGSDRLPIHFRGCQSQYNFSPGSDLWPPKA